MQIRHPSGTRGAGWKGQRNGGGLVCIAVRVGDGIYGVSSEPNKGNMNSSCCGNFAWLACGSAQPVLK